MLGAEFLLNVLFSQKMAFWPKNACFLPFLGKKSLFWQNEDVNKKKNCPQHFLISCLLVQTRKRMKFIALVVFKKDYFLLGMSKIQYGHHLNMQIRWPLTLTHFFILNGHWWTLVTLSPQIKKIIQCGVHPLRRRYDSKEALTLFIWIL